MNGIPQLFSSQELIRAAINCRSLIRQSAKAPFSISYAALQSLAASIVLYVEWEIFYRVFEYLSGEGGYWNPSLMALTAAIMVVAYHLLLEERSALASRLIRRLVDVLVLVFPIGAGLLVAAILYGDGVGQLAQSAPMVVLGELPPAAQASSSLLDWVFSNISNPVGVLAFSMGVGGLSVVNLFVVHGLLRRVRANIEGAAEMIRLAADARSDHRAMLLAQKEFARASQDIADEALHDGHYQALKITSEVQNVITGALSPHRQYAKQAEYAAENRFMPGSAVDPKQVSKDIARIDAITREDILAAIHVDPQED